MSPPNDPRNMAKAFRTYVAEETESAPETFARTDALGEEWNFSELVPALRAIFDLLRTLASRDLEYLPRDRLLELRTITKPLNELLTNVKEFTSVQAEGGPEPRQVREKLLQKAHNLQSRTFDLLSPWIAYVAVRGADPRKSAEVHEETVKQLNAILHDAKQGKDAIQSEGEHILKQASGILDTLRAANADVGVSQHSVHFLGAVQTHTTSSKSWLTSTVMLACGALLLSGLSLWHSLCTAVPFPDSVPMTVSKLAVLAVVYYAVIWSARMYRSERHNAVVNQHRHNALKSFETFVSASGDDATKNAVLLSATESIFSHQPSGFSDKTQEVGSPKILEVFRGLSGGTQE